MARRVPRTPTARTRTTGPSPAGTTPPTRTVLVLLLAGLPLLAACNPIYVARAGWAQAQILAAREPLVEVMADPATDPVVRGKLRLAWDARRFAIEELGFQNAGESYTSFAQLPSDTLALVLSAAYRDRLAFRTWWFPITGHVPYRAYFSVEAGERARDQLQSEGFDTHLRPTAAFSTLGWFADPLHSTVLRQDEVGVVVTVFHELAHNHLFLPGQGRFNESYATFAGHAAAIEFFCSREGGGPDTLKCRRAQDRWADALDVSNFLMTLESDIRALYARTDLELDETLAARDRLYRQAQADFQDRIQPALRATTWSTLADAPLNNATLLARTLYMHRLADFESLGEAHSGDLRAVLSYLRAEAAGLQDPWEVLGESTFPGRSGLTNRALRSGESRAERTNGDNLNPIRADIPEAETGNHP